MKSGRVVHSRPKMPRAPAGWQPAQLSLFDPLRAIEYAIADAYWQMTKSNQKKIGHLLYAARELIRDAGDLYIEPREPRHEQ